MRASARSSTCRRSVSHGFRRRPTWVVRLPSTGGLSARGRQLRNESIEIEIDAATGGIRSVAAVGESTARLGQQLVMTGLFDAQGKPVTSQMRCERFDVDYGGPALVQATSTGSLIDPQQGNRLASFVQRYRLWAGRPILEIEITLSDLDPAWLEQAAQADPWSVYLACRWAWPDPNSMLRRGIFWSPELTEAERPETPECFRHLDAHPADGDALRGSSVSSQARQPDARHAACRRLGNDAVVHARGRARPGASRFTPRRT